MVLDVYQDIMILEESGTVAYVGRSLLEDDDNNEDHSQSKEKVAEEAVNVIKENTQDLNQKQVNDIGDNMAKANPDKLKKPTKLFKFLSDYIMRPLKFLWNSFLKALRKIGNWILEHVPGALTIVNKIRKLFGKEEIVVIEGEKMEWKEIIAAAATGVVLVGLLGFIAKRLFGSSEKSESIIINSQPLVLTESDDNIKDSFTKKAPGIFGKIINFLKNVKDSTSRFIITVIGIMIGVAFFIILGLLTRPIVCKAIKFALAVDSGRIQLSGMGKAKYMGAKVTLGMANMLGDKTKTLLYDSCPCIKWENKQYKFDSSDSECKKYIDEIKQKAKEAQQK